MPQKKAPSSPANRLLAALPAEVFQRLRPDLELHAHGFKETLFKPGEPVSHVSFPLTSVISMITLMANGDAVEVGTAGNEGFAGHPVLLGVSAPALSTEAFCQIPGEALRMQTDSFQEALRREPELHSLLLRYTSTFLMQIAQSSACNRLHSIDERCCRWLLMTHDRVGSDVLLLTQEFLAQMLGVRRASVNAVATLLQRSGLIQYSRGRIKVLDRKGLEDGTCECYWVIQKEYERTLGMPAPGREISETRRPAEPREALGQESDAS